MKGSLYIGAYWGDRVESSDSCAARAAACLRDLAVVSPLLARWKPLASSRAQAVAGADVTEAELVGIFERGVNRRDADGTAIAELGYRWSAWNGLNNAEAGISTTCGACAESSGVMNNFLLELPRPTDEGADSLYERAAVEAALSAIVRAWEPRFAVATSNELRRTRPWPAGQPVVGWVTYVAVDAAALPPLTGARVTPLGSGTMIVAADGWGDVTPAVIARLADVLERSGAAAG